ncbi:PaaI family thioesterase [Bradyrhizobium liaoningense]|uniref:PaaI family thioesterase n=1 Tax=Bradyrhizobium liaoningense TaxID=43992 RepID=UPI0020121886|nr:PaaI family thioesterase [Bradyrhizobium liaoningense]
MARLRRDGTNSADPLSGPERVHQQARDNGFLAAMLDSATGICALAALAPDLTVVTKSLDTRFLKPAAVGPITARARVIERTDRDMVVQADLVDAESIIVADATARLRILAKK